MFNFLNNYNTKQRFKKSESLCNIADIILLGNLNKGIQLLGDTYPEIMNNIINKNTDEKDLPKNLSSHIFSNIRSLFIGKTISIEKGWKQSPETYIALQIYKEAALICPENPYPSWQVIKILHSEKRNKEAFTYYSKMPNYKINSFDIATTMPAAVCMLNLVDHEKEAIDITMGILSMFSDEKKNDSKKLFFELLLDDINCLRIDDLDKHIKFIENINPLLLEALAKKIAFNAFLISKDNPKEGLAWIVVALSIDPDNQKFLSTKKEIEQDLKKKKTENTTQIKSNETYLFFDTETTGLPRDWNASVNDVDNWPRIVQISWVIYKNGTKISSSDFIIKPEGFKIPVESSDIHGVTTERAEKEGVSLRAVLTEFQNLIEQADLIIAHNISFDEKIVGAEFIRKNMSDSLESKKTICTMKRSTDFCAIPSSNGYSDYKWPKLSELYMKLFDAEFEDAHNSLADVNATAKCFWEMKKRGIL